ncbi:hypothetical protein [Pseudaminobacter soli (ex Zhang et al. 2022)]|nr:hypothetical protein [Pseudaminobacter soli]
MPIRKRVDRRRAEALPAWRMVFQSGHDYFEDLADIGVPVDAYGRPDRAEAEAAWRQFGDLFLAECEDDFEPWALSEFGPPSGRHRRA